VSHFEQRQSRLNLQLIFHGTHEIQGSGSSTATPPQQAVATEEEDLVTINWIFFDKSDPNECEPLSIDVPRARFNGKSQNCQKLFSSEILDFLSLSVRQNTIKFWKVSGNSSSSFRIILTHRSLKNLPSLTLLFRRSGRKA